MSAALQLLRGLVLEDDRRWGEAATDWQHADAAAILEPGDSGRLWHFLTRPRGGSKSTDLAGVLLAWLAVQAGVRQRGYLAASDADQAGLVLEALDGLAVRSGLAGRVVDVQAQRVVARESGSTVEVLAADGSSTFGLRPDFVVVDEIAAWPETRNAKRVWTALLTAMGKRPGARMAVLTSAGDPAHFSYRVLEAARSSSQWRVSEVPGPLPWVDPANLAAQQELLLPSEFEQLHLNVWATGEDRLATRADVEACATLAGPLPPQSGVRYVASLDVGTMRDRTVAVVAHREGRRVVVDWLRAWVPGPGRPVVHGEVEAEVAARMREYGNARLLFDPSEWRGAAQRMRSAGLPLQEFTFSTASVGRLGATLYRLLRDHEIVLPRDDQLIDELVSVRLRKTGEGSWRLDHDSGRHDDRAVALALAAVELLDQGSASLESLFPGGPDGLSIAEVAGVPVLVDLGGGVGMRQEDAHFLRDLGWRS